MSDKQELALRYNEGKPQLSYISSAPEALKGLARVFEYGAKKYARDNWKKGLPITKLIDSFERHKLEFANGIDIDEESGLPHADLMLWNALVISEMYHTRKDMDDRTAPL